MLQAVVEVAGLREQIDGSLHLLRRHLPYHESDHVLALVYNLLTVSPVRLNSPHAGR